MTRPRRGFFAFRECGHTSREREECNLVALELTRECQAHLDTALKRAVAAAVNAKIALGPAEPTPRAEVALERLRMATTEIARCEREVARILEGSREADDGR